ncbi:MAG: hypothetical protein AAB848_01910 [Patescibacteria group bacterium]
MKRKSQTKSWPKDDQETFALKHWKYMSTKTKLNWLEEALRFGKTKKF